jgi:light-regulated signal transduction histidine kinase (bacteriophytochrome)
VQRPLDRLRHDARAVAEGELERHIVPVGPRELRQLGVAMEAMRSRIAEDLELATAARRQLEQQQAELSRSNAELEQFAYVASHDLQEPLRKVASFCQLLQNRYGGQLDERADQYIGFAVDGAKRMQALINDLLAFSRGGRLTRPFETVELDGLVAQAVTNLGVAIEEAGAELDIGPLPAVRGEPALLAAVFQNLIGNAVKFRRPDVHPIVRIRHRVVEPVRAEPGTPDDQGGPGEHGPSGNGERTDHARQAERAEHEFIVEDNGIGIEADYAERVFVIFQRLHAKEDYAGTGIGLALSRKIVEYHGGRIWVDTDRSGSAAAGTTIRFTLPVIEEAAPPPGDAAVAPAEAEEELSR